MARIATSRETEGGTVAEVVERHRSNYNENRSEAEKPYKERKSIRGREGESKLRKYHMTEIERKKLISDAVATGGVVNPLRGRVGAYWGEIEALILLGANEYHSLKKIATRMEEIMSAIPKQKDIAGKTVETNLWADFFDKPSRSGASKPKDGMGRIEQNFKVLQRLPRPDKFENNPYGIKLSQFGMCVDMDYREVSAGIWLPYVRLNTTWPADEEGVIVKPYYNNPGSRRRQKKLKEAVAVVPAETVEPSVLPPENKDLLETVAVENPPITVISDVEAVEAVRVAQDIMEAGEQPIAEVLTTPDEDTGLKPVPPDDFEQQVNEFEQKRTA